MKKKIFIICACVALVLTIAVGLCACGFLGGLGGDNAGGEKPNQGNKDKKTYQIQLVDVDKNADYSISDFIDVNRDVFVEPSRIPTKTGYTFDGWYLDKNYLNAVPYGETPEKESLLIYAKWLLNEYKFTVVFYGQEKREIRVAYNRAPQIGNPIRNGYVFEGWYSDESRTIRYDIESPVKGDITVYAGWNLVDYKINYSLNGGVLDANAEKTYNVESDFALSVPDKAGYEFVGWYDNDKYTGNAVITLNGRTGETTLYAKYHCNEANVYPISSKSTIEAGALCFSISYLGGEIDLRDYFTFSENCTLSVSQNGVISDGYIIWFDENKKGGVIKGGAYQLFVKSESGKVDRTYTFNVKQYGEGTVFVRYVVGGVQKFEKIYNSGETVSKDDYTVTDAQEGYEFDKWLKGKEEYDFDTVLDGAVESAIELEASFKCIRYPVIYSTGTEYGNGKNPSEYTIEDAITLNAAECDERFEFEGWYDSLEFTNKVTALGGRTGEIKLYARYVAKVAALWEFTKNGSTYEVTKERYNDFVNYIVFGRTEEAYFEITNYDGDKKFLTNDLYIYVPHDGYSMSVSGMEENGVYKGKLKFTYNPVADKVSTEGEYNQLDYYKWSNSEGRKDGYDYWVDRIATVLPVETGDQLYFALEQGCKPAPKKGSVAEAVYEEMKRILKRICDDGMSDKEKVLAIAEYLTESIVYDNYVLNLFVNGDSTASSYRCFSLEGAIIDKRAVCDGISKAFSSLCAMENVLAVRPTGTKRSNGGGQVNHAWNKVFIDVDGSGKKWYAVDCTAVNTLSGNKEVTNHSFILTSDAFLAENGYVYAEDFVGEYVAATEANVYDNVLGQNLYATDYESLVSILKEMKKFIGSESASASFDIRMVGTLSDRLYEACGEAGFSGTFNYVQFDVGTDKVYILIFTK